MSTLKLLVGCAAAISARPALWMTALRQLRVLCPPRWWARAPYLPVPDAHYLKFRLQTAYGGAGDGAIEPHDLVAYLEWCRSMRLLQAA